MRPQHPATLTVRQARRLALARAGLLPQRWSGLPQRVGRRAGAGRRASLEVVERFGYLQLDTVSIAGARSHALVLLSRLEGLAPTLPEELLQPGEPLFEYWGHEACWLPLDLYPAFEFRRRDFARHPWWGDVVGEHPRVADDLRRRIRDEGPLRSLDLEGGGSRGWWDLKVAKKVATALWSSGELAIRERRSFQRSFDLSERVIPEKWLRQSLPDDEAIATLLLRALDGHGWATTGTLAATWRLRNRRPQILEVLARLREEGEIVACDLALGDGRLAGWIRPAHLELAGALDAARLRGDRGVLLSPFDPLLWDRRRVEQLFGFHQVLEIFKRAEDRTYGYFCMPVLAGERLVARLDLKAERGAGILRVLSCRYEGPDPTRPSRTSDGEATRRALERHAAALGLEPEGLPGS